MHIDEIFSILVGFYGGLSLAAEIGMLGSVYTVHLKHLESRKHGNTFDQVHGRNHRSFYTVFLVEIRQIRLCSLPPYPYAVGRIETSLYSCFIHRMVF